MDDIKTIAHGEQPRWEKTYKHPIHGELTFQAKLPTARQLTRQSVTMDNLVADLGAGVEARTGTLVLASALAGLTTIVDLPVVDEKRTHDPELDRETVTKVFYDPMEETDTGFVVEVWSDFWAWRQQFIDQVDRLKDFSEGTRGNASSESSTGTTGSPSTIPA